MEKTYGLLVVGAGIAGCEAAWRAAELGTDALLISMSLDQVNVPAHLPALILHHERAATLGERLQGTLFGEALERSVMGCYEHPSLKQVIISFDRREFSLCSKELLERKSGLDARQALIKAVSADGDIVVESIFGEVFRGERAVFAPGCFVNGRIKSGRLKLKSGRYGDLSADELGESLQRSGVRMRTWQGMVPEVLDTRKIDGRIWEKAKKTDDFIVRKQGSWNKPQGEDKPAYWRMEGDALRLLVPLGRESSEACLVSQAPYPLHENAKQNATVRMRMEQECLVMEDRGVVLPRTVRFAGSFGGARGYLECARDGEAKAMELLEDSA